LAPWEQLEKEEIKKKKGKITKSFDTHRPSHGRHYPAAAWVMTGEKGDLSPGIGGWLHQQTLPRLSRAITKDSIFQCDLLKLCPSTRRID
jgi:hypothetical protein